LGYRCEEGWCDNAQIPRTGLCEEHQAMYYTRNRPVDVFLTPTTTGWVMDVYVAGINSPLGQAATDALHHRYQTAEEAAAIAKKRYGKRIQTLEKVTPDGLRPMVY
jgi:hypothetical protein